MRVCEYAYPDGGSDGHVVKHQRIRAVQSRPPVKADAAPRPGLIDFSSACLFCAAYMQWSQRRDGNAERSFRRSSLMVRRTARYNALEQLMTFTNGEHEGGGFDSRAEALDTVARFFKVHGRSLFGSIRAVIVAEQGGKGGRWHVHAAVPRCGWLKFSHIIRVWSSFMENRGYHAKGLHRWHLGDEHGKHKGGFSSARVAGRYMAKYLTKDIAGSEYGSGLHRYRLVGTTYPAPLQGDYLTMADALEHLAGMSLTPFYTHPDDNGEVWVRGYWFEFG